MKKKGEKKKKGDHATGSFGERVKWAGFSEEGQRQFPGPADRA